MGFFADKNYTDYMAADNVSCAQKNNSGLFKLHMALGDEEILNGTCQQ